MSTVTDVSTTCAVVTFRVKDSEAGCQKVSQTTVLFRTRFTRTIKLKLLLKHECSKRVGEIDPGAVANLS